MTAVLPTATAWPAFWVQAATGFITLGALGVAIAGTRRATKQANKSAGQAQAAQSYIERRDGEAAQREADGLARTLASNHAVFLYVKAHWSSIERPWPQFSVSVTTDRDDAFYLEKVVAGDPIRRNSEVKELVIFPETEVGALPRLVSNGIPWEREVVQTYLPQGINLPLNIPLILEFRDADDNLWRLDSDNNLTLLTPRRITSLPDRTR